MLTTPPPYIFEVKERIELCLYFPLRPSWPVAMLNFTFLPIQAVISISDGFGK